MQKDNYSAEEVRVLINMFDPKPRYRVMIIPFSYYDFRKYESRNFKREFGAIILNYQIIFFKRINKS